MQEEKYYQIQKKEPKKSERDRTRFEGEKGKLGRKEGTHTKLRSGTESVESKTVWAGVNWGYHGSKKANGKACSKGCFY